MPPWNYLPTHPEAHLSERGKKELARGLVALGGEVDDDRSRGFVKHGAKICNANINGGPNRTRYSTQVLMQYSARGKCRLSFGRRQPAGLGTPCAGCPADLEHGPVHAREGFF